MTNSAIWVLVANDDGAAICCSRQGASQLVRRIAPDTAPFFKTEEARYAFAWQLMSELFRGARAGAFDGVILVATPAMLDELRRVMMPTVRDFVVGEIVGELPEHFELLAGVGVRVPALRRAAR